jgi:hypothetical protein
LVLRDVVDAAFEVAVTLMVILPLPLVCESISQGTGLEAVHEQFAPLAVMAN